MNFKRKKKGKKRPKVVTNLTKTLLQYIKGKKYTPATLPELVQQLDIAEVHQTAFKEILDALVEEGEIALQSKKYVLSNAPGFMTGVINVLPKGFGFVRATEGPDIFIPKHATQGAVDGDTVEVSVNPHVGPKGPEGEVIAVLKRSKTHIACTIIEKTTNHYVGFAPLLGIEKPVKVRSTEPLKIGDRVICKVKSWATKTKVVDAEMTRLIGNISDPSIDIQAAVEEFELPDGFTKEAIDEAKSYGKTAKPENRKDLTDLEAITIDPDTAKDFDDAISLTQDRKGHFHLGVHIADVSHYVKPGTHLDQEAYLRCNSTYFPGECIPMLPFELSNELCSLKPKVIRLTQSVLAEFNPDGDLVNYEIVRSFIKSRKRFTYKEALLVLENKKKSSYSTLLKRMVDLCHLLKKKRFERGSIDFSIPEDVILVDSKGVPEKIETVEYDITHQMIEEFMLKANEVVATHLFKKDQMLIFRIHEEPTPDTMEEFAQFARSLGFQLPKEFTRFDLQKMFQEAKGSSLLEQLSISFIRSMKLAAYSPENMGHFGLALEYYCHFTSPIRRYSDLIVQRILFDEIDPETNLQAISNACSEKERVSFRAESSVTLLKKLRLAKRYFEEDPTRIYRAKVSRIKPFALFFEVPAFDLEGNVHVSKLGNDFFEYNANQMIFKGTRTGKKFAVGTEILVRIEKIDFILLQSEWSLDVEPKKPRKRR